MQKVESVFAELEVFRIENRPVSAKGIQNKSINCIDISSKLDN